MKLFNMRLMTNPLWPRQPGVCANPLNNGLRHRYTEEFIRGVPSDLLSRIRKVDLQLDCPLPYEGRAEADYEWAIWWSLMGFMSEHMEIRNLELHLRLDAHWFSEWVWGTCDYEAMAANFETQDHILSSLQCFSSLKALLINLIAWAEKTKSSSDCERKMEQLVMGDSYSLERRYKWRGHFDAIRSGLKDRDMW